jgi:hypothetical protein
VLGAEYLGMLTEGDRLENPIVYARRRLVTAAL